MINKLKGRHMSQSRTSLSLKNSTVALGFYFVNLALQFYSRRIFLDVLGTDILGLNTTATSLLQFLNLAELGIGSAVGVTLYKPILKKNYCTINEIVSLQGWLYRRIAIFIIIGSFVLMGFFPIIFAKSGLPLWYAYASYAVLLFSALLGYFVNYKQIVLSASQQEFYIRYTYNASLIVKVIAQVLALKLFSNGYVWWLVLEIIFATIASSSLSYIIKKKCPFLNASSNKGHQFKEKYPEIITKVKQMFFHKASRYALTQTSPLIIYAYASLTLVAVYGNYMLIITGLTALLSAVFDGINAGVGNLVAEGNKQRINAVFRELFTSRFVIVSSFSFSLFYVASPFISLWIGEQYLLDNLSLLLLVIIFFLNTSRTIVDSFISAYGLFRDIWAPIVEASINVGFSILLGSIWGLPGILTGVALSLLCIVFIWKPFFLFTYALKTPVRIYVQIYLKHLIVFTLSAILVSFIIYVAKMDEGVSITRFLILTVTSSCSMLIIQGIMLYTCEIGMQSFVKRILKIFK